MKSHFELTVKGEPEFTKGGSGGDLKQKKEQGWGINYELADTHFLGNKLIIIFIR